MTSSPPGYNFASAAGIDSVAGAVIFAVLYAPLLLFYIRQSIARPTYVFIVLALFCAVRIAAFVLRALLAGVAADAQNLNLLIVFEVVYNVGFFGLLYSAYTLVLDRGLLSDAPLPGGIISVITRRRIIFRVALVVAVAVGITGAVESAIGSSQSTINLGNTLRQLSTYIFFALSLLVALQVILLIRAESAYGTHKVSNGAFGATYGIYILCLISFLLVAREAFFTFTSTHLSKQNDEHWWYPFAATTELVAVIMFAAPGLVPSREELPS
ncbi:hypothetical protein F5I97DRAFT_1850976 [Phlebopus sp. FC_14]|nr:hypothetical protein F5I97DRAFT_1850976 [Phlebopus sp. FC_14]